MRHISGGSILAEVQLLANIISQAENPVHKNAVQEAKGDVWKFTKDRPGKVTTTSSMNRKMKYAWQYYLVKGKNFEVDPEMAASKLYYRRPEKSWSKTTVYGDPSERQIADYIHADVDSDPNAYSDMDNYRDAHPEIKEGN